MVFLADLNKAGWTITIGPLYVAAVHAIFGGDTGRGDDLASRLDDLRAKLQRKELCE